MRRLRANAAGIADQLVNAGANAATGLLVYPFLPPEDTGDVLFALACGYFVVGVSRAVVGDVLLAHTSRYEGEVRRRHVRDAAATALGLGFLGTVLALVASTVGPHYLVLLVWLAPFLPFLLLHDAGRYAFLAEGRPERALVADLTYVAVQAVGLVALLRWGARQPDGSPAAEVFLLAWGLGAVAGALSFVLRARINPLRGRVPAWLAESRHLSGWFTATAVLGQAQVQLVYTLVVDVLSKPALATLRLAQYGLLMPAQNLQIALASLLVPRMSRLAHAGDVAGLRRLVRRALGLTALAAAVPLLGVPLAGPALRWLLPEYAGAAALALPVALQAAIYLLQLPFGAAMRGMHAVRALFAQYAVFTGATVVGLLTGALWAGLVGAAWGMTSGAVVGFAAMLVLYRRATARHVPPVDGDEHVDEGAADATPVG